MLAGTLSFSDGTSIAVGALPADGKLLPVTFAPKTVTWVRFTVDQAQGTAAGLSEIQVLGVPRRSRRERGAAFPRGPRRQQRPGHHQRGDRDLLRPGP